MNILILANNDIGLYQFRKELIEELLKKNTVSISLPDGELVQLLVDIGCKFIDTPIDRRGMNPKTDLKLYAKYRKILKKEKPDLVITYTIKPDVYGGLACRRLGIPYAENITGLGTAFQNKGLLRTIVTILYRVGLKKAKVVFFENEKIVSDEKTCLLMGAGVNLERYHVEDYPKGDITKFLFMGRVMKEKGIDELFTAMRRLQKDGIKCSLDVLGYYEEDYKAEIKQYEDEGWLHYHGYQLDVRPFIEQSHCFVLPSWHEGMANTNLECAASARPIITTNICGCKESVIDGKTGYLCEKKNSDSLYEKMKCFCYCPFEDRKQMGIEGRKHIEANFDKIEVVRKTIAQLMN
jgi:galacturonosyltransferase